jgi:hypothetical protein
MENDRIRVKITRAKDRRQFLLGHTTRRTEKARDIDSYNCLYRRGWKNSSVPILPANLDLAL